MPFWLAKASWSPAWKLLAIVTVAEASERLSGSLTASALSTATAAPPAA